MVRVCSVMLSVSPSGGNAEIQWMGWVGLYSCSIGYTWAQRPKTFQSINELMYLCLAIRGIYN